MNESSLKFCPVPLEQQPVHEYEELKESWFFRWATLDKLDYGKKLIWVAIWGWIIGGPIVAASFPPAKFPLKFGLGGTLAASLLVALFLARLYLGWLYIRDRLNSEKVIYEESGWYDGQVWPKPPEVLTRDRLIATYQVEPIIQRLQGTTLVLVGAIASESLLLLWL